MREIENTKLERELARPERGRDENKCTRSLLVPCMHRCQVKRGRKERTGLNRAWGMLRGNDRNGMEPGGRGKLNRKYRIKWLQYDRTGFKKSEMRLEMLPS